jgi:RNA polymerase sigma factor (sigma-70 family)
VAGEALDVYVSSPSGSTVAGDKVLAFLRGDAEAAEWLVRRAGALALRTSVAILGSREQAGDVAQDVVVDVLRSAARLREPDAFDAWVHRITVRHASRALRHRRKRERAETNIEHVGASEELAAAGADLDHLLTVRDALSRGFSRLPAKQQLALTLRYVHDLSDEQIAAALGCRPGTVHALLSRGRATLRNDNRLVELSNPAPGGSE